MVKEQVLDRVQFRKREVGNNYHINPESNAKSILISSKETLEDFINNQRIINKNVASMELTLKGLQFKEGIFKSGFNIFDVDGRTISTDDTTTFHFQSGNYIDLDLQNNVMQIEVDIDNLPRVDLTYDGFMTKEDYRKLRNIEEEANHYIHDKSPLSPGTYLRVSTDDRGHVISGNNNILSISEGGTGANNLANAKENLQIPKPTVDFVDNGTDAAVSSRAVAKEIEKKAEKEHGNHVPNSSVSPNELSFLKEGNEWEEIQSASITQKGVVQLSNEINGTRIDKAVTEKALKDAIDSANNTATELYTSLIEGADDTLNTFKEIGDWIDNHQDLYTNIISSLANKVDKQDGYGLSENNLSDQLKHQYDLAYEHSNEEHAPSDAERNEINSITINNNRQYPTDRNVNISIPYKTSELDNDAGFLNKHPNITQNDDLTDQLIFNEKEDIEFEVLDNIVKDPNGHITNISSKRISIPSLNYIKTITSGNMNGTILVDNVEVEVKGLGTAAYKNESDFTKVRVKGNKEDSYRTGDVNLTPENIGALSTDGGTVNGNILLSSNIETRKIEVTSEEMSSYLKTSSNGGRLFLSGYNTISLSADDPTMLLSSSNNIIISTDVSGGNKFTFNGNAKTATTTNQIRVLDSDPTNPVEGEIWITR